MRYKIKDLHVYQPLFFSPEPIAPGTIRLVDGANEAEGRVEVYYDFKWGAICDDDWDYREAHVVCKELGFPGAKKAVTEGTFPMEQGEIILDDFACNGLEDSLLDCDNSGWNQHDCRIAETAGVICFTNEEGK